MCILYIIYISQFTNKLQLKISCSKFVDILNDIFTRSFLPNFQKNFHDKIYSAVNF